jgi:hypothetical protein
MKQRTSHFSNHTHTLIYACMHVFMYVCIYLYMYYYVCTHVRMYVYIYIYNIYIAEDAIRLDTQNEDNTITCKYQSTLSLTN